MNRRIAYYTTIIMTAAVMAALNAPTEKIYVIAAGVVTAICVAAVVRHWNRAA